MSALKATGYIQNISRKKTDIIGCLWRNKLGNVQEKNFSLYAHLLIPYDFEFGTV